MRKTLVGLIVSLIGCAAHAQTQNTITHVHVEASGGSTQGGTAWIGAAPVQNRIIVGSDGQTYVGVWIDAPNGQGVVQRAPIDLALVIDNSGSMSGEKIQNARMAASSMLESLVDGDIVSIYAFSNDVMEIAPPTTINSATRGMLIQRVQTIQPLGGTNMYDGLRVGEARVAEAPSTHTIRRVVLISDGMANIGPSSPEELGNLAAQGTETGAQVSAIGVGLEYDENTLGALAMRSAGRLYHLSQPSEMASILREELQRLSNTVATDAYIEVDPASGVEILGSENAPMQNQGGHVRVQLGTLTGGQHREILLRARVDTSHAGDHALANARLVFHDASGAHAEHAQLVPLSYAVTGDAAAARRSVDGRVQAMVASNDAAQAQLRAVRMMNQGQTAAAAQVLQQAEQQLAVAAAAAPADERERITRQAGHMHHSAAAAGRAATPSAARSGALEINADAYHDMGM